MTTRVRFCLSYDTLKWGFVIFKINNISIREWIVDTDVVNDVTCTVRAKVLLYVWSYDFYDMTLSTDSNMTFTFSILSV